MSDPRFFQAAGQFSLAQLAEISGAEIRVGSPDQEILDVAPLATAGADDISFLDNPAYAEAFAASKAGACIVGDDLETTVPEGMALLVSKDVYKAYALVARAFYPDVLPVPGVAADAVVDPTAMIGPGAEIGPGAVIGPGVEIGKACRIGANAVVGAGVKMGDECDIGPLVSLKCTILGDRVRIYAGARIGEDGFGYASDSGGHLHIPQLGRVLVGNGVEIGANTTIDRGSGPDTIIGDGSIIDNLVQIGHNVRLGKHCIIVAQVGISGSTTLGDYVVIGGQAGLSGHLKVGDGVRAGARSGIVSDLEKGSTVMGTPAIPHREYWRQVVTLKQLSASRRDGLRKNEPKKDG